MSKHARKLFYGEVVARQADAAAYLSWCRDTHRFAADPESAADFVAISTVPVEPSHTRDIYDEEPTPRHRRET